MAQGSTRAKGVGENLKREELYVLPNQISPLSPSPGDCRAGRCRVVRPRPTQMCVRRRASPASRRACKGGWRLGSLGLDTGDFGLEDPPRLPAHLNRQHVRRARTWAAIRGSGALQPRCVEEVASENGKRFVFDSSLLCCSLVATDAWMETRGTSGRILLLIPRGT